MPCHCHGILVDLRAGRQIFPYYTGAPGPQGQFPRGSGLVSVHLEQAPGFGGEIPIVRGNVPTVEGSYRQPQVAQFLGGEVRVRHSWRKVDKHHSRHGLARFRADQVERE